MSRNVKIRKPVEKGVARVPVVMQMEALECGAACLTMVLAYYRKWIPLEQVRLDCGVSRDGSNAKNVLLAARNYGLEAAGYRLEPEMLKEQGQFPCIVHWEFDHFVVVNGFKNNKVYINDPARGNCVLTMEAFDAGFTGIALMFEPGENFTPSGHRKSMVSYAKKRLEGAGGAVAFMAVTTLLASLLGIMNPGFGRVFLDFLLTQKAPSWVPYFFAGLAALTTLQLVTAYLQAIYSLRIDGKLAVVGNTTYLWKVLHLPMEFFGQRLSGDIQMRQAGNAKIASSLVNIFAPLLIKSFMMIFYLVVMLRYNVMLSMIGIIAILINIAASNFVSAKRVNISRVKMRDMGKLAGTTISGIEMIETIKSSGAENGYFEKWAGYQANVNAQDVRFTAMNQTIGMIPTFISSIANMLILFIGVYLTTRGEFTIGKIMAFQGLLATFTEPAMSLISAGQGLQEMQTDMERIEDVMSYPEDPMVTASELKEDESYQKLTGEVEMRNVTFGYSKLSPPLITDFNLTLHPGQSVAFVGASGCGKSTLAKLLSGLNRPWSGEVLFDGQPIGEINRRVFTGSVSVVDQDITMFEDTISNNIKMWDRSIEDFEMIMAAKDAQIHDVIALREGGYDHVILEGGKDFSGGERQRMELARVLAQDPTIIILDEATSALDARTEAEVVRSIKDRGITCIVIAHRLSTIRDCDEIIVMDHGKVVERGKHKELFEKGGLYAELIATE
ncbi:MAG: NHLP family bacteriocin export ABC transporter peptidase/permease/ATPase subunit [Lachnospiraceae bacterium]|nr:NHLP family bacteriocin export ABC transporter peptidase/permease/ATPase subunit [Lachnospiraceae bacterium]